MTPTNAQKAQAQSHEIVLSRLPWNTPQNIHSINISSRYVPFRSHQAYEQHHRDTACDVSDWTNSRAKRVVDFSAALFLLVLLAPVLCVVYVVVRTGSRGPAIFSQERVGKGRSRFIIYKFRTMVHMSGDTPFLRSSPGDSRLTKQGPFLRKYKLDELPQLVNVLRGEMSLVGPRPKLPQLHIGQLPCRPGLTGQASLAFAAEALLVKGMPEHLLEELHAKLITPLKLQLDQDYMEMASFASDLGILWRTIRCQGCYRDIAALNSSVDSTLLSA